MSKNKEQMDKLFDEQVELLKPEGDVHNCIQHFTELMREFFNYLQEIKERLDATT